MPSRKSSRQRHLSKLAARRAAERRRRQRQRIVAAIVAFLVAGLGGGVAFIVFTGSNTPNPAASPTESVPPVSPSPTVTPTPRGVACGGRTPAAARTAGKRNGEFKHAPKTTIDRKKRYRATMATSCGAITFDLFADKSPATVNSFVFLAKQHFFDGLVFHRIANTIDVIQSGDPTGSGTGGPGYTIPDEYHNGLRFRIGSLAMANTGAPHSGGSQFFVITGPKALSLPPKYTVFGQVVKGLGVAKRIQALPVSGETPLERIYIEKVTIDVSR